MTAAYYLSWKMGCPALRLGFIKMENNNGIQEWKKVTELLLHVTRKNDRCQITGGIVTHNK